MENGKNILRSKFMGITVYVTAVVIVLMVRLPLFGLLMDILIAVNIIMALFFFIYTIFVKKAGNFTLFIYTLTLTVIYGFVMSIAVPKSILDMKENFNVRIVKFISSFFEGMNMESMVIAVICIVAIAVLHEFFINKCTDGIIKTSDDYLQVHYKDEFLYFMDIIFAIFMLIRFIGVIISITIFIVLAMLEPIINEEDIIGIYSMWKHYAPLVISNGIVCLIPYFLLSAAIRRIVVRYVQEKERSHDDNDKPLFVIHKEEKH